MSVLSLHRKERSNVSLSWVVSGSSLYACHDAIVGCKTCHSKMPEGIIGKGDHPESTGALKVGGFFKVTSIHTCTRWLRSKRTHDGMLY